ncbi:MAG: N-acetyltransferase [Pirellulales bacterium]|nr:N-acetyltransferase [Pirellulales bacterium]
MPDISTSSVSTRRDRKEFLQLAWDLYRQDPNWAPPLLDNIKQLLGWKKHPFHDIADVECFLARREGKVVGRIVAIHNREHNREYNEERGFFGFFECIDDQDVANALFDTAVEWCRKRNLTAIRGPANPSMNYECGLLIDGFDSMPVFMMTYNPPYYEKLIDNYGFKKAHDLLAYIGDIEQLPDVESKLGPIIEQAKERSGATIRPMNRARFKQDVDTFLEMYNRACGEMWGFVPLTRGEVHAHGASLKWLLVRDLALLAEVNGKTVGVVLGLPDFNPAIKKIRGRLFPFGFLRLLAAKRKIHMFRVVSIDVVPEFQRWGLGLVLMNGLVPKALELNVKHAEFSWVSEENTLARMGLEKGGARQYKTYRMYDFEL